MWRLNLAVNLLLLYDVIAEEKWFPWKPGMIDYKPEEKFLKVTLILNYRSLNKKHKHLNRIG